MGVYTKADECENAAVNSIADAITQLSKIVIDGCWGSDDYGTSYFLIIQESFKQLLDIHLKLAGGADIVHKEQLQKILAILMKE